MQKDVRRKALQLAEFIVTIYRHGAINSSKAKHALENLIRRTKRALPDDSKIDEDLSAFYMKVVLNT